ncbi:MAG: hypothetical protein JJE25_05615 [Bacteroidia bacterium]|nr:hypothetical protein [Bacteroidia bacterium]
MANVLKMVADVDFSFVPGIAAVVVGKGHYIFTTFLVTLFFFSSVTVIK